jgi:CheY-like chemotaxis protein
LTRDLIGGLSNVGIQLSDTPGAELHALIIEDEYLFAKALQDMLQELGFTKFSFAGSTDAAIVGNLCDVHLVAAGVKPLPREAVSALEAICAERQLPLILITAFSGDLREQNPDAVVLQKPIRKDELASAVHQLLHGATD